MGTVKNQMSCLRLLKKPRYERKQAIKDEIAVVDIIMNVTIIWYRIAMSGDVPASMSPVIMPGSETMPSVFVESIVGTMPVRTESRSMPIEDFDIGAERKLCFDLIPPAFKVCRHLAVTKAYGHHCIAY